MKIIELIKRIFNPPRPEDLYEVSVTDKKIICKTDKGEVDEITWKELNKIEIHTNDGGPFIEDVYWILYGENTYLAIPQGAPNSSELTDKLFDLPNFDSREFYKAMSSTENAEFNVWKKRTNGST